MRALLIAVALFGFAGAAHADPCEGTLPPKGTQFSGTVRYIADGDGLCVGKTDNPSEWIEVRVANFYAPELSAAAGPEAKATMARLAMGKPAACIAGRKSWDRTIATCLVNGSDIGDQMRAAGIAEGGRR